MPNRKEVLYQDFTARLRPRMLWNAEDGTAVKVHSQGGSRYTYKRTVKPKSGTRKPTEAEDNAIGRAVRRRHNRRLRGWLPFAKR